MDGYRSEGGGGRVEAMRLMEEMDYLLIKTDCLQGLSLCTYKHTHTHTYIYTYIHTYIHTQQDIQLEE